MSNPARAPKEYTQTQLDLAVSPDAFLPEGFKDIAKKNKSLVIAQGVLAGLDMEVLPAFYVPREYTVDQAVLNKSGPAFALAKTGVPEPRVRSAFAKRVVSRMYAHLPLEGVGAKEKVASAMRNRVFVDAGTEGCLGRIALAYPKLGVTPRVPVTKVEAELAVRKCGVDLERLPMSARRPFPLNPVEGELGVTVNPHSDNGFPVGCKWSTPGAAMMAMSLAVTVRGELDKTSSVELWMRAAETLRPWLVAVKGKAKADYYAPEKIVEARMRFYNAFPRQMMLIMQQSTQVLEQSSLSILASEQSNSGIGITLVRGGAGKLVKELEERLQRDGHAYVHVGDDSWVVLMRDGVVHMFALDCSNFDLTQHGTVTLEVHKALRARLGMIDKKSADLWFCYARERIVVLTGSLVRKFTHAGPSGMPLQSKVNDMLMEVMVSRAVKVLDNVILNESTVARAIEDAGEGMGFVVRLEQYWSGVAEGLVDALSVRPFLFIGNYFHVRGGEVRCCADVPRTMAQLPYPGLKWAKTGKDLQETEAMRLGSIAMNLGMPPMDLEPAFKEYQIAVVELLNDTIKKFGDSSDARLRWAVQDIPWGAPLEASLKGLLSAVLRDPRLLWMEKPLVRVSQLAVGWADIVEEEEEEEAGAAGGTGVRPRARTDVSRLALRPVGRASTHPVSVANDGRPPPVAVWDPDKPKASAVNEREQGTRRSRRSEHPRDAKNMMMIDYGSDSSSFDEDWGYKE